MTGKDFKEWARTIHDEATIEYETEVGYRATWAPLNKNKIRASLITQPATTLAECNNLEEETRA